MAFNRGDTPLSRRLPSLGLQNTLSLALPFPLSFSRPPPGPQFPAWGAASLSPARLTRHTSPPRVPLRPQGEAAALPGLSRTGPGGTGPAVNCGGVCGRLAHSEKRAPLSPGGLVTGSSALVGGATPSRFVTG